MPLEHRLSPTHVDADALELYVRSFAPETHFRHQRQVIDRMNRLVTEGTVDSYSVRVWGKRLVMSALQETEAERNLRARIEAFWSWARNNDLSIAPFFPTESVHWPLTDETCTVVTLPGMTLAEYAGDDLGFVSPCTDGERVYTVANRLDRLEAPGHGPPTVSGRDRGGR